MHRHIYRHAHTLIVRCCAHVSIICILLQINKGTIIFLENLLGYNKCESKEEAAGITETFPIDDTLIFVGNLYFLWRKYT